jgi:hypothetical protein
VFINIRFVGKVAKVVLCSFLNITPKKCSKEDLLKSYDLDLRSLKIKPKRLACISSYFQNSWR